MTGAALWWRLTLGLAVVFALFDATARALGSDRGQAGVVVGAVVLLATLSVNRVLLGQPLLGGPGRLGIGTPRARGIGAALLVATMLVLVVPLYIRSTGTGWRMLPGWIGLLPGLFAQAGVAEEALFRGYLFRHLRQGRPFKRAVLLSTIPFVIVHLLLFLTMPWMVALMSVLLSAIIAVPLAYLFELGGNTIWGPAIVHWVVQGTVKVVLVEGTITEFASVWMLASALVPFAAFIVRRPEDRAAGRD